ncbi:MAG TPA: sensor domain-containing diguanylate cyclase [Acidobacteriaceae bacterium]|nr:sensor domain-containing diguanylate cyclase [Acidobacteriaceae bacterium]
MISEKTPRRELVAIIELLTALLTSGLEAAAVMRVVAERAAAMTGATGAVIEMVDGAEMVYRAASGSAEDTLGLRLKRAGSLSGLCVEQGIALHCEDASTDARVDRAACARVGLQSMICVPLFHAGRTVGVLKVLSSQKHAFDAGHTEILEMLAGVIAASLANADRFAHAEFERDHDVLTGLGNRRAYEKDLALEFARARRYGNPLTLALLDLNGFKAINDTYGHPAGDDVLRRTAAAMRRATRGVDRCFRVGGDEFAVLFPETERKAADRVMERVLPEIEKAGIAVSASAGLADLGAWTRSSEMHAAADQALYAEKDAFHRKEGRKRA